MSSLLYHFPFSLYVLTRPLTMSLATRDNCFAGPYMPPYYNRAFTQTSYFPQYGLGGNHGLQQWVDHESSLTIPYQTRAPNGCTDTLELHPDLTFDHLPTKWQQDDYRPFHFEMSTRQSVKDMCNSGLAYGQEKEYLQCLYRQQPQFYQGNGSEELYSIFNNRYV